MARGLGSESLQSTFEKLSAKADSLYKFVVMYNDYIGEAKDYGTGRCVTMREVHLLTAIEENPGTTVTELAEIWKRTKGAICQTVTRLEKAGYVLRRKEGGDTKTVHLYPSEEGIKLSKAHKAYDMAELMKTLQNLLKHHTTEEIDVFYRVLATYIELMEEDG